ncbi:hypothetical protein Q8F55_007651 [Vanrija albida]|uniref:Uncharacterized protein n=1 Tax=Vanrija albida TaxID=181172 RepID=A0ABR3PU44_9TREE
MGNCLSRTPPEPVVDEAPPVIPELRLDLPRRWPTILRREDDGSASGSGSSADAANTRPTEPSAPSPTVPTAAALATLAGAPRRPLPRSVSAPYGRARTFPRRGRPATTTDATPLPSLPSIEVEPTNWSRLLHSASGSSQAVDDLGVGAKRRSVSFQAHRTSLAVGPSITRSNMTNTSSMYSQLSHDDGGGGGDAGGVIDFTALGRAGQAGRAGGAK